MVSSLSGFRVSASQIQEIASGTPASEKEQRKVPRKVDVFENQSDEIGADKTHEHAAAISQPEEYAAPPHGHDLADHGEPGWCHHAAAKGCGGDADEEDRQSQAGRVYGEEQQRQADEGIGQALQQATQ